VLKRGMKADDLRDLKVSHHLLCFDNTHVLYTLSCLIHLLHKWEEAALDRKVPRLWCHAAFLAVRHLCWVLVYTCACNDTTAHSSQ
jgi:hypothetical protein